MVGVGHGAAARSTPPGVVLKAAGKKNVAVPIGTKVTIAATLTGKVPRGVVIKIVGTEKAKHGSRSTHECKKLPCQVSHSYTTPAAWFYHAVLYDKHGKRLATSGYVVVQWLALATVTAIGDGAGTTESYFAGAKSGQVICTGSAVHELSHCNDNQNVGTTLTITASVDGALPSGAELWITYSSGNQGDPTYTRCDPAIKTECVLARAKEQAVQTTVTLPAHKTDYNGMHNLDMSAKIVGPQGVVAGSLLSILICEQGQSPVCG
jgi:hypothetical protein